MLRPGSALFDTGVRRYIEFRASIMWPEPIALQRDLVGPRGRSIPSVIPFGALQLIYPAGYADSALSPHLPQDKAEIMGGRTPTDEQHADPASLAAQRLISTTTRPRTLPSSKRAPTSMASARPISFVMASSLAMSRSRARRAQAS